MFFSLNNIGFLMKGNLICTVLKPFSDAALLKSIVM
jgi:hypothetical protein